MSQIYKTTSTSTPSDVATSYVTNSGTATPSANVINVVGGTNVTTSGSGDTITINATGAVSLVSGIYGDGSDSSVTFDGSSVILGLTPSSSIYTLARDIFLASSKINSGVTIITNGFKIYCNGTLTNDGTISFNGNAGLANGTAGAALTSSNSTINNTSGALGLAGGAGNTGAGTAGSNSPRTLAGAGGAGGAGSSGGGGAGTITAFAVAFGSIRSQPQSLIASAMNGFNAGFLNCSGGSGGGGGGGDGTVHGGGGGSGGGLIVLNVYLFSGTGLINAIGGAGGSPTSGTNAGGGGGGGGGVIWVNSDSVISGSITGQTLSVAGGALGTGFGSGANGHAGNNGITVLLAS